LEQFAPDGDLNRNSMHQGSPVMAGTKYVVTKWYRERPVEAAAARALRFIDDRFGCALQSRTLLGLASLRARQRGSSMLGDPPRRRPPLRACV
jgi:hypothetical protein